MNLPVSETLAPPNAAAVDTKADAAAASIPQQQEHEIVLGALTKPKEPKEPEYPHTAKVPPDCTPSQKVSLQEQLPSENCIRFAKTPWNRQAGCSFSEKTRCGNANPHWLYDFLKTPGGNAFHGMLVGCQKGSQAVELLRMVSSPTNSKTYSVSEWGDEFSKIPENEQLEPDPGCDLPTSTTGNAGTFSEVHLYCFDGAPNTVAQLGKTKAALGYGDELEIVHSVVGGKKHPEGLLVKFTDQIGFKGAEELHWNTECRKKPDQCEIAPATTIDDFVQSKPALVAKEGEDKAPLIHYLKVIAGISDYAILKGAAETLERIMYIDFQYHWYRDWNRANLEDLIFRLKKKGFVCYFTSGEDLWRITGCWQDHYSILFEASLGCVNGNIPEAQPLLNTMEDLFAKTLAKSST